MFNLNWLMESENRGWPLGIPTKELLLTQDDSDSKKEEGA